QPPPPLAVLAVENQHAVAGLKPQHAGEVMPLGGVERHRRAGAQRRCDKKPGGRKIVTGHVDLIVDTVAGGMVDSSAGWVPAAKKLGYSRSMEPVGVAPFAALSPKS